MIERDIHRAVCDHLHRRAVPGVLWFHPYNNPRNKIAGAMLKRMGMLAGASDLIFFHNQNFYALELKAPGGRATDKQLEFQDRVRDNGGHAVVSEGLDRALAVLESWGLLR